MKKNFQQAWNYRVVQENNLFSIFLNEAILGSIQKPLSGRWPIFASINGRVYLFSKVKTFNTIIEITNAVNNHQVAVVKFPVLANLLPHATLAFSSGKKMRWVIKNFFSFHWQWKQNGEILMDAIDNLAGEKNKGIVAMTAFTDETELLIITGFFLSLMRRSKLTFGVFGLKNPFMQLR